LLAGISFSIWLLVLSPYLLAVATSKKWPTWARSKQPVAIPITFSTRKAKPTFSGCKRLSG
jgi:hypothetical protein